MNHYGAKARKHWQTWLPDQYASIRDPEEFFTRLGEVASQEIEEIAEAMQEDPPTQESYLEGVARVESARKNAEMRVVRELLLVDPEDQERIRQLLG